MEQKKRPIGITLNILTTGVFLVLGNDRKCMFSKTKLGEG